MHVLVDLVMPGKVTEFHDMKGLGKRPFVVISVPTSFSLCQAFMVSVTQFPDSFREEVYWLSPSGME